MTFNNKRVGGNHTEDRVKTLVWTQGLQSVSHRQLFLPVGQSDNGAESGLERRAWENVKAGMCGGNTVCSDDTPESALRPLPERLFLRHVTVHMCLHRVSDVISV